MNAIICNFVTGQWMYRGFYFEFHRVCGPVMLNKLTHDPIHREPPERFWRMWEEFSKLPKAEQDKWAVDARGRWLKPSARPA